LDYLSNNNIDFSCWKNQTEINDEKTDNVKEILYRERYI